MLYSSIHFKYMYIVCYEIKDDVKNSIIIYNCNLQVCILKVLKTCFLTVSLTITVL